MRKRSYYIINGITVYRLLSAPVLVLLVIIGEYHLFKWLLALSFFTDAIDGWLARRFKVETVVGARLDSIADDSTVAAGIIGMMVWKQDFIEKEWMLMVALLVLFLVQTGAALIRYGKMTSFHTYAAKLAAVAQGIFLLLLFCLPQPLYTLFYVTVFITGLQLIEETIMVLILPQWQANVKSIFQAWNGKRRKHMDRTFC
jgi:Phosphatidylserine synthase